MERDGTSMPPGTITSRQGPSPDLRTPGPHSRHTARLRSFPLSALKSASEEAEKPTIPGSHHQLDRPTRSTAGTKMRASASVTISTGKNLKVDCYGKNTESCAHNSMAWTEILDASAIPEHPVGAIISPPPQKIPPLVHFDGEEIIFKQCT